MTFEEFKETFTLGTSTLKPDRKKPIEIRGYYRNTVIDYPNPTIHKWKCNYGKFNKVYKSFDEALESIYQDLKDKLSILTIKTSTIKEVIEWLEKYNKSLGASFSGNIPPKEWEILKCGKIPKGGE